MRIINYLNLEIPSKSRNESLARVVIAAFATQLDPTLEELNDVKTAVSEAVTNAIIHGYENNIAGVINIKAVLYEDAIMIEIEDKGSGIEDLEKAREPLFTSKPEQERSGMGFAIMENFMDKIEVITAPGVGTKVIMHKGFKQIDNKVE